MVSSGIIYTYAVLLGSISMTVAHCHMHYMQEIQIANALFSLLFLNWIIIDP